MKIRVHPSVPARSEVGTFEGLDEEARPTLSSPGDGDRWQELTELGTGGMGRVCLVYDRLLQREVAVKEALTDDATARLAREARVTASLQHPGIVQVHDVRLGPDGRPRYVMPVVRGSSLADLLAAADGEDGRLRLLRPFHAACQAVAYAHEHGVVHRDLTAANVMLGAFGEVQIIDWGLAVTREDTGPISPAGTPGSMSPEQERGAPADPRSDVWSLGALLRRITTPDDGDRRHPALDDIVARATAEDPAARYADAGELARDLDNYLEGRRVDAHAYTNRELLVRLLQAWRRPLAVAAVGLILIAALVIAGVARIAREQAVSDDRLGNLLLAQARSAIREDRVPEATVLAAHALARDAGPEARGVLALTHLGPAPERRVLQTPPCRPVDVDRGGAVLCLEPGAVLLAADGRVRLTLPVPAEQAAFLGDGDVVAVFSGGALQRYDATTGEPVGRREPGIVREGVVHSPDGRSVLALRGALATLIEERDSTTLPFACGPGALYAAAIDRARHGWAVICDDGTVATGAVTDPLALAHQFDAGIGVPPNAPTARSLAILGPGRLLAGEDAGALRLISQDAPPRTVALPGSPFIRGLLPLPGGRLVVVTLDDRPPIVFDVERMAPVLALPDDGIGRVRDAGPGAILVAGDTVTRWRLDHLVPPQLAFERGVADLVFSADGRRLAVAHGATVSLFAVDRREPVARFSWQADHVKAIDFAPDGELVAFGFGDLRVVGLTPGQPPRTLGDVGGLHVKRLVAVGGGRVLGLAYAQRVTTFVDGREGPYHFDQRAIGLAASPDKRLVVARLTDGGLRCVDGLAPELRFHRCGEVPLGGEALAVAPDAPLLFVAGGGGVDTVGLDGADDEGRYAAGGVDIVTVDAGRRWLVAGARDGSVVVWRRRDPDAPWALLRADRRRVGAVAVSPGDGLLAAGSWSGRVALLDPSGAERSPATAESTWGLPLEKVLDRFVLLSP